MNYSTGDHVICINDHFPPSTKSLYTQLPTKGHTYVVRDIRLGISLNLRVGEPSVLLVGIINPKSNSKANLERGFRSDRFIPLSELKSTSSKSETELSNQADLQTYPDVV